MNSKSSLNVILSFSCLSLCLLTFIFGEVGKLRIRNFLCFLPPLLLSSSSSQTFFDPLFHRRSILVVVVRHNKFCYVQKLLYRVMSVCFVLCKLRKSFSFGLASVSSRNLLCVSVFQMPNKNSVRVLFLMPILTH